MGEYYDDFRSCQTVEDLKSRLNRFFESFFSELDSMNVVSLDTNKTSIHSTNGETVISGPLIEMSDNSGLRLKMGYDTSSGNFFFELFNKSGSLTINIDSDGNANFKGAVSSSTISSSTINGGTISGSDINGGTINVQNNIKINPSFTGGIDFGGNVSIYSDPAAGSLLLNAPEGIWANDTRLDTLQSQIDDIWSYILSNP